MNTKKIQAKRAANAAKLPNDIVKLVEQSVAERPELTPVERVHTELLDPLELEIVSLTPSQIVSRTTASDPSVRLTAVQVAAAYIKTATIAQVLTNCLTESMFEAAMKRAEEVDAYFTRTGQPMGILHGVPVSLKESMNLVGVETSLCYVAWMGSIATVNTYQCDIMLAQGAIFHCKTTLPLTVMTAETISNVFGTTVNPFNTKLTPGGSSGGESALLSMLGSPVGIGTDIAGSVRIPAACTGIYALKPSSGRMTPKDACTSLPGQETIPPTHGPMARSIDGLEVIMRTLMEAEPWNLCNKTVPIPWRKDVGSNTPGRWVFGVMMNDGVFRTHPPITRALGTVIDKLRKAGHEVVEWVPGDYHAEAHELANTAFRADSCARFRSLLEEGKEEPVGPILMGIDVVKGERKTELSVSQLWQLHGRRNALSNTHLKKWSETAKLTSTGRPIDGLLCSAGIYMAPPHGEYKDLSQTALFNVFDHTAGVFPVRGSAISDEDVALFNAEAHAKCTALNAADAENWNKYNPNTYKGPPVGLQIVGRKYEEEKVIEMMKVIEASMSLIQ